jgi:hypothetical protein
MNKKETNHFSICMFKVEQYNARRPRSGSNVCYKYVTENHIKLDSVRCGKGLVPVVLVQP